MQEKYPLVLMSGGLDSTYLTYSLLKTTPVDVLYVRSNQGEEKIRMELKAVEHISGLLNTEPKLLHRIRNRYTEVVMDVHSDRFVFQQVLPWMIGALKTVDLKIHSKVCFGYVLGDQAIGWKTEMMTAWDNLCEVLLGGHIPLEFPLMRNTKEQLILGLPFYIRNKIWVCELPHYSHPEGLTPDDGAPQVVEVIDNAPAKSQLIKEEAVAPDVSIRPDQDHANYFPCGNCPACRRHRFVMQNAGYDYPTIVDAGVAQLRAMRGEADVSETPPPSTPAVSIVQDVGVYPKSEDGMKVSSQ